MRAAFLPPLAILLALFANGGEAVAQYSEAEVKAAFIYNIAKFVDWPADALPGEGRLRICHLGAASELSAALTVLEGRTLAGRVIEVRQSARAASLGRCQVLVVAAGVPAESWQPPLTGAGVLTIGENQDFTDSGGMVTLIRRDDRLAFDVNLDSARRARLTMSAQLLRLAARVRGQQ